MTLTSELKLYAKLHLRRQWKTRNGLKVPQPEDVRLGNDAVELDATVLYADLAASTELVDCYGQQFAAKMYKVYLFTAAKVIRSERGVITAYDGDRIMAVFRGRTRNTQAVRAALMINYTVQHVINPGIQAQYPGTKYVLQQKVGIDTSRLFVARTGVRGSNDLVWVGSAANYAAKLCDLPPDYATSITEAVYHALDNTVRLSGGRSMWDARPWPAVPGRTIYRSVWGMGL